MGSRSAVSAMSLRAPVFFFQFEVPFCAGFLRICRPASLCGVLWISCVFVVSVCFLSVFKVPSIVWVPLRFLIFHTDLQQFYVCLTVLAVSFQDFGKAWQVCC